MLLLRKVDVDVRMRVQDAEDLAPDERETNTFHCQNFVSTGGQRTSLVKHALGVGGEVRGELKLTTRLGSGESVVVDGVAKLFEGSSENTNDLEDSEDVHLEIGPGQVVAHQIFLLNQAGFQVQADQAFTDLTFTNINALQEIARRGGVPLTARHSGKVLDVAGGSSEPGAALIQFAALDQPNQRFRIEPVRQDLVRVVAVHSGLVLDVAGASPDDGAPLIQFPWHGGDNQLFRIEPTNGDLVLVAVHSGKVLDVTGASTKNKVPVTQFSRNFQRNQQWYF